MTDANRAATNRELRATWFVERALASEPGYALAELLAEGLKVCLPPAELRRWIEAAADGALPA